jgi:6-phosphogluconolactonase
MIPAAKRALQPTFTRRSFLALLPAVPYAARSLAQGQQFARVYFGTDTAKGVSKGIYEARFNVTTGELSQPVLAAETVRPSFLAMHPGRGTLYAVNAIPQPTATVSAFSVGRVSGRLELISKVSSHGDGPCYVSVHPSGEAAYVANYFGGSFCSYALGGDGSLSPPVKWLDGNAVGPDAGKAPSHIHCATFSPDGDFLLACDLGRDRIYILRPQANHGSFQMNRQEFVAARPGSGPRHVAFHPSGRWVYCIHELDSTIDLYDWRTRGDRAEMSARPDAVVQTRETPGSKNAAAEVMISADGRFLYASNRGEDSVVVYGISDRDGTLTLLQRISSEGNTPRHFTFDPTGRWILLGNQDSATVQVFRRDAKTGKLYAPENRIQLDSVMYTLFD